MGRLSIRFIVFGSLAIAASTAVAAKAVPVDIRALAAERHHLIGKHVPVHGCLTNSPHGEFIGPCGSNNWREITSILDSNYKGLDSFQKLGINYSLLVEGDFSGCIVEKAVDWPQPGTQVFLELESIANIRAYEP